MNAELSSRLPAPVQGVDSIVVACPIEELWPLIADSGQLLNWGPPVVGVEVLDQPEGLNSRRRVQARFGRRLGTFTEQRIIHDETHYAMAFVITADTFGLGRLLSDIGSVMQLRREADGQTRLVWSFFHTPRGLPGSLMNKLVILRQQRRNRLEALRSFKDYAETGRTRPTPQ